MTLARLSQGPSMHPRPWMILLDFQGEAPSDDTLRLEFIRRDGAELSSDDCDAIRSNPGVNVVPLPNWYSRVRYRDWLTKEEALEAAGRTEVTFVDRLPGEPART